MMFLSHIALAHQIVMIAAGFIAFHFAYKQKSTHLRIAGWILVIGGVLGLACISYYNVKYWHQGAFDRPEIAHQMNVMPMHSDSQPPQ
jgi:hypothetical protein